MLWYACLVVLTSNSLSVLAATFPKKTEHTGLALATVSKSESTCHSIKPASLFQKVTHPWTGDYKFEQRCTDVAILTNTGAKTPCQALYVYMLLTCLFGALFGVGCYHFVGGWGIAAILLTPFVFAWYYMLSTGLLHDYRSGAMSWTVNYAEGVKPNNVSSECLQFVSFSYTLSVIILFYAVFFSIFFGGPFFMLSRMRVERHVSAPVLNPEDRAFLDSAEFKAKCIKAFRDADEDHNNVLDLKELQHVTLSIFDLTDEEKKYVQDNALFQEAFTAKDADNSNSIDSDEFVEVMKFIMTKAKAGAQSTAIEP